MNRVHWLRQQETEELTMLHRTTKEADVRSRCEMILLSDEGLTPPQIAQRVRFSRRTVTRYIQRYDSQGLAGLFDKPKPGRPRRATADYIAQLQHAVSENPRDLGRTFSNWTTENLATYLMEQTGITLSARQVENYLKANRWRLRRPVRTVKHKQDPALVQEKKTHGRIDGPDE